MEWSNENRYNSFNSYKGLAYYDHYRQIVRWLEGTGKLPPPIECSYDPICYCNQRCTYCNSQRYLRDHKEVADPIFTKEYIKQSIGFLADWGVKALCWGGGGESLMNKNVRGMTKYAVDKGLEVSIITNGALIDEKLADELTLCRWIGISVDSCDGAIYQRVRGTDDLPKVILATKKLVQNKIKNKSRVDIAWKVLVLPETIETMYETCYLARELGIQDFHIRPVDLERKDFKQAQRLNLDMPRIAEVFKACHALETDNFRVFTVTHKYDENFHVKHDFEKCSASPLVYQWCTDKRQYVCVDHRLEPRFRIEKWGSNQHRDLLLSIMPNKECGRCTWAEYNRQISEVVINDKMCLNFP